MVYAICLFSLQQRKLISFVLLFYDLIEMGISIILMVIGVMMRLLYNKYSIVKNEKMSDHFPNIIIFAAISFFIIHAGCAYVDLGITDWRAVYKAQEFFLLAPLLKIICQLIAFSGITYLGSMFIDVSAYFVKNFEKGIVERMKTYHTNVEHKAIIDEMQYHYRCCGGANYKDWLNAYWFQVRFSLQSLNRTMATKYLQEGYIYGGVVPFSCCNIKMMRPCVTWLIEEPGSNYNYDPKVDFSLYERGCGAGLTETLGYWMMMVGYVMLYSRITQGASIILSRLVQTSLALAIDNADPTQSSPGYIIVFGVVPKPPGALTDPEKIKQRQEMLQDLAFSAEDVDALAEVKLAEMDRFNMEEGYAMHQAQLDNLNAGNISGNRKLTPSSLSLSSSSSSSNATSSMTSPLLKTSSHPFKSLKKCLTKNLRNRLKWNTESKRNFSNKNKANKHKNTIPLLSPLTTTLQTTSSSPTSAATSCKDKTLKINVLNLMLQVAQLSVAKFHQQSEDTINKIPLSTKSKQQLIQPNGNVKNENCCQISGKLNANKPLIKSDDMHAHNKDFNQTSNRMIMFKRFNADKTTTTFLSPPSQSSNYQTKRLFMLTKPKTNKKLLSISITSAFSKLSTMHSSTVKTKGQIKKSSATSTHSSS